MSIIKNLFGKHEGKEIYNFVLDNNKGLSCEILSLGGIIKNLYFDGVDVSLGRDNLDAYLDNNGYLGALIGRNSNRIENAAFTLNGKKYTLAANNNGIANLHGGNIGFDSRIWDYEIIDNEEPSLVLSLVSPDGEEGFPGEVNVTVTYTVTKENSLKIHYEGTTDADTILNMTNHCYFNLNGHNSGKINGHTLEVSASYFTPNKPSCLPNGEIFSVDGTPFDLRKPTVLEECFNSSHAQVKEFGGFDHNFVLDGQGFRHVARLIGDKSGIVMDTYTDLPGVQVYTANMMDANDRYKANSEYGIHSAVCLETQYFPNAINYPHFISPVLKKGEKYDTVTEYIFSK